MIRAHVDGVLALLRATANLTVYDGVVPNAPVLPYVVVWSDQGRAEATALAHVSDWRTFTVQTTYVGSTQVQVRALAERVETALLDKRPGVTGRTTGPLTKELTQPVRQDTDVDPPLLYALDVWRVSSVPTVAGAPSLETNPVLTGQGAPTGVVAANGTEYVDLLTGDVYEME